MMDKKKSPNWRRSTYDTPGSEHITTAHKSMIRISNSGRISMKNKHNKNRISLGFEHATESLVTMLNHPDGVGTFRAFLRSEFSEENLDFWLECESYRDQKPNRIQKHATKIYQTYIGPNAPREVNLDASTKSLTLSLLKTPDKRTFDAAQNHIFKLMESDPFRRFMSSNNNNSHWK